MHLDFFKNIRINLIFFERFGNFEKFSNLKDKHWILTLAFLVNINLCHHLNVLNLSLQVKNIWFFDAITNISAFKSKLALYRAQLENYDYSHFENFKCDMPDNFKIEFYHLIIDSIIDDFFQRFDQKSIQFFLFALTIHKKSSYFYIGFIIAVEKIVVFLN